MGKKEEKKLEEKKLEEKKQLEEIFNNLFQHTDIIDGMNLIKEELKIREEQGYDVSKYRKKYFEEARKYPQLKNKLN
ncbi:hypothetical protein KAI04_02785 [Candidatus Pacearchaeota archaeon]|nr:hypothetical protein [Candidatus Pacearchaeota archaeon]